MRVFIGIKLSDDVHEKIGKFLKPFQRIASPVRWVKPENVHITLKFIGDMTQDRCQTMIEKLPGLDYPPGPFDLTLAGCGKFGRDRTMNIFWIGMDRSEPLHHLYDTIENALAPLGIAKETRPFKPHLTVARNKRDFNFKSFYNLIDELRDKEIARFPVSSFQVIKSDLTPDGPIYTVLKEIALV